MEILLGCVPMMILESLQWGHNFFVMEILPPTVCFLECHYRFNGAITFSLWKFTYFDDGHVPTVSFNGAITFSLWKFFYLGVLPCCMNWLQWGHNFFVMEILGKII